MKIAIKSLFFLLLLSGLTLSSCGDKNGGTEEKLTAIPKIEGWKSLEKDNYMIQYPETWKMDAEKDGNLVFKLLGPAGDSTGTPQGSVNLVIEDLQGTKMSLKAYVDLSITQLNKAFENYKEKSSGEKTMNGRTFYEIVYNGSMSDVKLQLLQRIWMVGGNAYVLTYGGMITDDINEFEAAWPDGEKIINSFGIK